MINELKKLSDSMERCGIQVEEWHNKFYELRTSAPCFIISLTEDGRIADIRFLENNQAKYLRTYQGGGNGETFPAFNFTPFYRFSDKLPKKGTKNNKEILHKTLIAALKKHQTPNTPEIQKNSRANADRKTMKCLTKIADDFFNLQLRNGNFPLLSKLQKSLYQMLDRESDLFSPAERFNSKLLEYLIASAPANPNNSLLPILLSDKDVILFFDVEYPEPEFIASSKTINEINHRLLVEGKGKKTEESSFVDAFGYAWSANDMKEKMPAVKFPNFMEKTIFRSMSKEEPCQKRYGRIDSASYPAGNKIRRDVKKAMEWICCPDNKGKTWEDIGEGEILFAYPLDLSKSVNNLFLARTFGNGKNNEKRFLDCAHDTLLQLAGRNSSLKNIEIELFAIKRTVKARHQIVYNRNYNAAMLQESVLHWKNGVGNLPEIKIRSRKPLDKEKTKNQNPSWVELPFTAPYPLSVIKIIYTRWHQESQAITVPKCSSILCCDHYPVFDGLELFFDSVSRADLTEDLLSKLITNGLTFLVEVGKSVNQGEIISSGPIAEYVKNALPVLGILLYKLNIRKESYMNESPYLIGRMLNLTDRLHALYCKVVRKGNLPNELLGGSFYPQCSMNPVQAFAVLGERIRPYLAWAKTVTGEKAGLARWLLAEIGKTADALKANSLPKRMTDADKAQMLLGFLGNISSLDGEKISAEDKED